MVDEDLVKKTKLMSECFSTDDELDGSEDNLEESKETKRKEKKRKRSGSFQGVKIMLHSKSSLFDLYLCFPLL